MKKRNGWKAVMAAVVGVVLASVCGIRAASACSLIWFDYVSWPLDVAQSVPLNAKIFVSCISENCEGLSIRLLELPGRNEQPLELVSMDENRNAIYAPTAELKASTEYQIELNGGVEDHDVTTFTTGTVADHEAPVIAPEGIVVDIEYVEAGAEFSSMVPGACGLQDVRLDSIPEEYQDDYGFDGTTLPAHYHIVMQAGGLEDATGTRGTSITVMQIGEQGDFEEIGSFDSTYVGLGRIEDAASGEVRTYRLRFEDILGNAKEETIDVVVTFDEAAAAFSVKESGNGGGETTSAAAGCSLDPQAKASGGAWAIGAMFLLVCASLFRRSRIARSAALAMAAIVVLAGCSAGTDAGAGGEANSDCASYGGTLSGYVCEGITEEACASLDGAWRVMYDGGDPYCELPAADAGTECADGSECEKYCAVVCEDSDEGCNIVTSPNTRFGRCAATHTGDDCMYYWDDGEREVVCVDPEMI